YPGYISRPLTQLTQGIKEIANRNYDKRLQFKSHDELGELALAFNQMAAKLDEYEHSNLSKLMLEKKRIDTIINNMKDAIIGLDESGQVVFANTVACEILQLESSGLTGKYAPDLLRRDELFRLVFKDIDENKSQAGKDFHPVKLLKDGKALYYTREILDVALTKTGENVPVNVGRVIIMKNITDFLEQAEAKTNFIATISHELKTPISSLRLNLKLLDDSRIGDLNEEQKDIIKALKEETHKMSSITSELLDLAQVETGNIPLNLQPVDPAEIIRYVKSSALNQARNKNIHIRFSVPEQLPPMYCDSEKTAWVLLNMLNNAILYSPEGSPVEVEVKQAGGAIRIMVRDFGMGIEPQYLQQIFEKYFRVPDTGQKGTGLGLAISKEFISKQHGSIWVESTPGKGSRFYFELPLFPGYPKDATSGKRS
ncbi:MAG: ATP-binding protein, partial [Mangrovibacterium sp.]|nr:ATP-binding protein [Mangrovibacterium sp.]